MINIHLTVPFELQEQARRGIPISEWDVRTVEGDQILGIVEDFDDGFMYTDSFGITASFFNGEDINEVMTWVYDSFNYKTVH